MVGVGTGEILLCFLNSGWICRYRVSNLKSFDVGEEKSC